MRRFWRNNYWIDACLIDNWKMNRRKIFLLAAVMLVGFLISIFFVGNFEVLQGAKVVHFYLIIFTPGSAFSLFISEFFGLALFLAMLCALGMHFSLIPVICLFFAYRGFALAVLVWNLFSMGVFVGIAGLILVVPFVLLNYCALIFFGAYCISGSLYFRRCRRIDFRLLIGGLVLYLVCILALLLAELLLFLCVLRPFFGLF